MAKILIGRNLNAATDSVTVPGSLITEEHDWIGVVYNTAGKISVVTYKLGGAGGITVAVLTLAYAAGRLTSVTKT